MCNARFLLSLLTAAGLLARASAGTETNNTVIPKQFIIEVAQNSSLAILTAAVEARGAVVSKIYDSSVFTGLSVQSMDGNVNSLQAIGAASAVWPSRLIKLGRIGPVDNTTDSVLQRIKKRGVTTSAASTSSAASVLADEASSPNYSVHGMTGVDKLHAAGIYGKGVQVALIDTGVEYTHPALGGCFGAGCKIGGGYDLVGNGCWPLQGCDKAPGSDPMDLFGVGTSMAGVIVGVDVDQGYAGVAPEATIYSYKVFTAEGETDDDTLIEAFLMAFEDGADVISASVVGPGGFVDDPLSVVASRLVDKGVVVTMASGNYGSSGPFYASSGSSGSNVLAVAGVEANFDAEPYFDAIFTVDGESSVAKIAQYYPYNPMPKNRDGWPIIPLTNNTNVTDDACEALTGDYPDYSAALTLVRLGGCSPLVKQANLIAAGARNIIFYWDPSTYGTQPLVSRLGSFVLIISDNSGEAIVKAWQQGGNVTANFSVSSDDWSSMADSLITVPLYTNSWGPLYDLSIKPDVSAPGGRIFSTFLDPYKWLVQSDSGLASAYVAGVAALYIGQYGGRKSHHVPGFSASDLAMRIISSGSPVPYNSTSDLSASVAQVGTGLINATKVLEYSTQLSYSKFELNDTRHFERYQKVDITNRAHVDVTYIFAVLPAAGIDAWTSKNVVYDTDTDTIELNPRVSLPNGRFIVRAGTTRTAHSGNLPLYSGSIQINSSLGESLSVPYLGLDADLSAFFEKSLVPTGYPYIVSGRKSTPISVDSSWSFDLSVGKQDFPKLYIRNDFGSDELRWDIFDASWTEREWRYPPVTGRGHFLGSATYWQYSSSSLIYDPADSDFEGNSTAFPVVTNQRLLSTDNDSVFWWLGPLANGSNIAPGNYTMRVAALLPFGDRQRSNGWSTWVQPFSVV